MTVLLVAVSHHAAAEGAEWWWAEEESELGNITYVIFSIQYPVSATDTANLPFSAQITAKWGKPNGCYAEAILVSYQDRTVL